MIKFFIPDYKPDDELSYDDIFYIFNQAILYAFFIIIFIYYKLN